MPDAPVQLAVFIDYDNLLETHKTAGILDIVTSALLRTPLPPTTVRGKCEVRIYGGWYEGSSITASAQDLSVEIQRDFPAVVRLGQAAVGGAIATTAELAVALLEEPAHHLFDTYRRKGVPRNVRVEEPASVGCVDTSCVLPQVKKILKTGECPKPGCKIAQPGLLYRSEQKIVDTMLTCDLIYAATQPYDRLILISGDDDFLPPLRTALLRGAAVVRFHPKPNSRRASFPIGGSSLIEMDL